MYAKLIWIALIIVVLPADGKKTMKNNRDEPESTPQPNMLSYSTFGFKDAGSYNGFVPSSPDFNNYHNNDQEPQMKLYAPAFPSAIDSTGLGSYYEPIDQSPFGIVNEDHTNVKTFQPIPINFFTSSSDSINAKRAEETKEIFELNVDNSNLPTYGTKLSSKARKPARELNNTEYNILDSISSVIENNYSNNYASNVDSSHQTEPIEDQNNINYSSLSSSVSFPKVVDFTSAKKYYPTSVESRYTTLKPIYLNAFQNNEFNSNDDNKDNGNVNEILSSYKTKFNGKDGNDFTEKDISPVSFLNNQDSSASYPNVKNSLKINKYKPEYKDKLRIKQFKENKDDHSKSRNPTKGYEYSTNYSTASFHFDYDNPKRPFNSSIDEILPESSSLNFVSHKFPDKDFTGIKTLPTINFNDEHAFSLPDPDTYKPSEEYLNAFKSYYSSNPSTLSHWGNLYKPTEFSSTKKQRRKPYLYDDGNEEIVHIPKRPHSSKHGKYSDSTLNDWYSNDYRSHSPSVTKQPEWPKDFIRNKFKTDEDLLGLRNQDDLSSSYLNPFKYNDLAKDFDYDKLSERWRQSYLKSKIKESNRDYESFASDAKEVHIPRPKPYAIEVPHPVIVPVPQPYPVKVPIPKPVAIPVIQELKVPVEKPMPYPVFKKVPYIVERPVPVPVEKQVRVPVVKPYPVHVPQVRPVFHHSKYEDEDEYEARPDTRRPVYKRHKNTRNRPRPTTRRPPRMAYRDHQKRHPTRRPVHKRPRRPNPPVDHSRYEDFEDSDSDFERYCKRTGKC